MLARLTLALPLSSQGEPSDLGAFQEGFASLTGRTLVPLWLPDYDALVDAVVSGQAELAWAPPVIAIELERRVAARPLVVIGRAGGLTYYGAIVAKRTSGIKRTRDLAGRSIAWVSPTSAAGYLVPRLYLLSKGLDPRSMFREERFGGTHHASIELLLRGEVDAAAVFAQLENAEKAQFRVPGPEHLLRIVATVGPIPADVIVARGLEPGDRTLVAGALLALDEAALAPLARVTSLTRFEPVPIGHLDPLRKLAAVARAPEGRKA